MSLEGYEIEGKMYLTNGIAQIMSKKTINEQKLWYNNSKKIQ